MQHPTLLASESCLGVLELQQYACLWPSLEREGEANWLANDFMCVWCKGCCEHLQAQLCLGPAGWCCSSVLALPAWLGSLGLQPCCGPEKLRRWRGRVCAAQLLLPALGRAVGSPGNVQRRAKESCGCVLSPGAMFSFNLAGVSPAWALDSISEKPKRRMALPAITLILVSAPAFPEMGVCKKPRVTMV